MKYKLRIGNYETRRRELWLNQTLIAAAIGKSRKTVNEIVQGKRTANHDIAGDWARHMMIAIEDLFEPVAEEARKS